MNVAVTKRPCRLIFVVSFLHDPDTMGHPMGSYASCTILIYKFLVDINRTPLSLSLFSPVSLRKEQMDYRAPRLSVNDFSSSSSFSFSPLPRPIFSPLLFSLPSSFCTSFTSTSSLGPTTSRAWLSIWCRRCQIVKQLKLPRKVYVRPLPPGLSRRDRIYIEFARTRTLR